jgi:hypothetical protein
MSFRRAILATCIGLAGCASQPTLLRWSKASGTTEVAPPTLYVTSQPADPATPLTARTLPERASAAYITALAANQKDADKLRKSMATPIGKGGGADDRSEFARVMVVELQRGGVRPGDRFMSTQVEVRPTVANGKPDYIFDDYQQASTSYTTINVGTVSITNQQSTSLSVTPTFGGAASPSATASYGVVNTDASTRNISERPQLSVNVAPDRVVILQTGAPGIDLAGNTLVKLALKFPDSAKSSYYLAQFDLRDDKGKLNPPDKASVKTSQISTIVVHDIYVCARASYVDRTIESGAQYQDEGRQDVRFVTAFLPWAPYLVVPADEIDTPLWVVMGRNTALQLDTGLARETLAFDDYDSAQEVVDYLKAVRMSSIGGQRLLDGSIGDQGTPLTNYDALIVKRLSTLDQGHGPPSCS